MLSRWTLVKPLILSPILLESWQPMAWRGALFTGNNCWDGAVSGEWSYIQLGAGHEGTSPGLSTGGSSV